MVKVYVSGKMTGVKNYNRPKFNEEARRLREEGYDVFNPAEVEGERDWEWQDYMRECLAELPSSDFVYLLDGWEDSRGAMIEVFIANTLSIPIIYEQGDDIMNGRRIRNGQIRRDFKRLLAIVADKKEPDYSEVEAIARRNGFYYDDKGEVTEI